ncbi:uncharacterized protein (DUF362 family) [Halanaerobium saccharolyticum]|uniref:Uncharacterized protein (DUF362 family) n=1 Tax=Halanaerobium saccharolyticum TaxID=43595 RepID=A0A4R7YZH0_9FIRM|nr:DUF362 domain-containing protein [Halanaerobium saccharolyticum]RAK12720.1 uncharacterized protein (DUF362 family) [Halanaerobium saccharolyticum]TDW02933.1 uncharacterized protein (DUF362 family) [Halanaerobium saccharolyticum]TDX62883.1 uncharacterized protein (DUF362 family) [Halanaerobium saccharolyticum]
MEKNQIFINYGDQGKVMVKELLQKLKIEAELQPDDLIALKPNLVNATKSEKGATTDPEIVKGVIEYLQARGLNNLMIIEGSWVGADTNNAFEVCGYQKLARDYEISLYNLKNDNFIKKSYQGLEIEIAEKALQADYLINLPVLKGHCQTNITCALKNLKGCISDSEKRKFHRQGLQQPIAYLNKLLKQDLIIVDGIYGDLDFEEGGNPVKMNRIIAAQDPVLVDSYAAELLGYSTAEVEYIEIAAQIGVGSKDLSGAEIIELNQDRAAVIEYSSRKIKKLAAKVKVKDACSACYGSLIHALKRIEKTGQLDKIAGKIKIGQGYQGEKISGIGIGSCCSGADSFVKGCPPSARAILDFLEEKYQIRV